jgi:hypothetical protein
MILPNGLTLDKPIRAADWSRSAVDIYDGKGWDKYPNLVSYAKDPQNHGTVLVLEASSESFELAKRQSALDAFAAAEIDVLCYNSKHTAKYRRQNGIKTKSNKVDAKCIYLVATTTNLTLSRFKELVKEDALRQSIKNVLVKDRAADGDKYKTELVDKYFSDKTPYDSILKTKAGDFRSQVGSILVTAEETRKAGGGFRKFRALLGNYGNGYGSIQRSEFYQHLVMGVCNSELGRHPKKGYSSFTKKQRQHHKGTMKNVSAAAKWIWKQTSASISVPTVL